MSEDSTHMSLDEVGEDNQENSETSHRHIRQLGIEPPEEWEGIRIGEIGELDTSSVDKKSDTEEKSVDLVNYMDVYERNIINNEIDYMEVTAPDSHVERSQVVPGDILFTPSSEEPGDIGNSAVVTEEMERTLHSYHTVRLRPTSDNIELDIGFSGWLANAPYVAKQFARRATGSTRYTLTLGDFAETRVLVPPVSEQRKIASVLFTIDEIILKTKQIIEQIKIVEQGLKQDLLIDGINHNEYQEVSIGPKNVSIPREWDLLQIQDIGEINPSNVDKKSNESEDSVYLCNYMDVYENEYITNEIEFMEATATTREKKRFSISKGDVMFTKDSEDKHDIAVPAVVKEHLDNVLCGYHLYLLKPNENITHGAYLSKALQSYPVRCQFSSKAQGLTRYGLNVPAVEKSVIPIPPLNEQKRITEVLQTVDDKIARNEHVVVSLESIKAGLMQDLLSGEVRTHDKDIEIVEKVLAHG